MATSVYLGGSLQNLTSNAFSNKFASTNAAPRANILTNTENQVAYKINAAGTLSLLGIQITANAQTSNATGSSRINSAAGNQTITITAGVAAYFQDVTHTDSVSAGQTIDIEILSTDTGHNITTSTLGYRFDGTSATAALYSGQDVGTSPGAINGGAASSTKFLPVIGTGDGSAGWYLSSETPSQEKAISAGATSRLGTVVSSNSSTNSASWTTRKNGANGNQTITIAAAATGYIEDTTHTDSIVSGDLLDVTSVTGAGTVNANPCFTLITFTSSGAPVDLRQGSTRTAGQGFSSTVSNYLAICGQLNFVYATESNAQTKFPFGTVFKNLIATVSATSGTGAQNMAVRKNGSTGNSSISINPAATGTVQDTTHTDSVAANDLVNLLLPAIGSGLLCFSMVGLSSDTSATNVSVGITQAAAAPAAGTVVGSKPGSATLGHTAAVAAAHALAAGPSPILQGVSAHGVAGDFVHLNGNIKGVQSYAIANAVSFYATPIAYFPGVRIMRNTPVPGVGEMDNGLVAGIGRMYVCGPQPVSREFFLIGVATIGEAAGIQSRVLPTNELTGAAASCFAGTLTTTSV